MLQSMTTKRHQTENTNMAEVAQEKKKYGHHQILAKIIKADKQEWSLPNYFENLEITHIPVI